MKNFNEYFKLFTPRTEQVFAAAVKEAKKYSSAAVGSEHVLLGVLLTQETTAAVCLRNAGITYELVVESISASNLSTDTSVLFDSAGTAYGESVAKLLKNAYREARTLNYPYIGVEQILLALLFEGEGVTASIFKALNADRFAIRNEILRDLDSAELPPSPQDLFDLMAQSGKEDKDGSDVAGEAKGRKSQPREEEFSGSPEMGRKQSDTPCLKAYGKDMTELARNGKLDPVIGREKEIRRVVQILCRRTKNNAVLIGEAGVGKTAIAEGLALAIAEGRVPGLLLNKRIVALNLTSLVAGTKYRGQFEERIKNLMDEVIHSGQIILFLDEIHTIVHAGNSEGGLDVSNIMKPALSRGELQCIGATTMKEYRKTIEKDSALERRFQSVIVAPPSPSDTLKILEGIIPKYEEHHDVKYSPEALKAAIELSERYLPARFLPDKVIDIVDEAGSLLHIKQNPSNPELFALKSKLEAATAEKNAAMVDRDFEKAADMKERENELKKQLEDFCKKVAEENNAVCKCVDVEIVRNVVSSMSGVPLNQMAEDEICRLLRMEQELGKAVIGQEDAVHSISKALRRSRAELKDSRRPIGSFLFLGPTGVGKTLLAKVLSEFMFGSKDALIRIDMSEYMEKFNVSRMIGSSPGYVGYEEGGQLTERVKRNPYSVVLFDEIEKAHPDVTNILLQIMEDGQLTDGGGVPVSFRNCIIVMTSNLGSGNGGRGGALGFAASGRDAQERNDGKFRETAMDAAKNFFKPEFLNRLDEVVVFKTLQKSDMTAIIELEIGKLADRLKPRGAELVLGPGIRELILEKDGGLEYGARFCRRQVENLLEDPLADAILSARPTGPFRAEGTLDDDGKTVKFKIVPLPL